MKLQSLQCIVLILLDLSSAFDTIDYDLLYTVFERHLGISGTALKLLKSFLTGRSQAVIVTTGILGYFAYSKRFGSLNT